MAIILVDRAGRRALFLEGGVQMLVAQARAAAPVGVMCCDVVSPPPLLPPPPPPLPLLLLLAWLLPLLALLVLLEGGVQMLVAQARAAESAAAGDAAAAALPSVYPAPPPPPPLQVAVGILLGVSFSQYNTTNLPSGIVYGALVLICIFVAGFAW